MQVHQFKLDSVWYTVIAEDKEDAIRNIVSKVSNDIEALNAKPDVPLITVDLKLAEHRTIELEDYFELIYDLEE